jgi:hypothetical protein
VAYACHISIVGVSSFNAMVMLPVGVTFGTEAAGGGGPVPAAPAGFAAGEAAGDAPAAGDAAGEAAAAGDAAVDGDAAAAGDEAAAGAAGFAASVGLAGAVVGAAGAAGVQATSANRLLNSTAVQMSRAR